MKAQSSFYNCKISAASSKEFHSLLAKTKLTDMSTFMPLPDLTDLLSDFFLDKIIKIDKNLILSTLCSSSLPVADPFDGVPLCTF